MGAFISNRNKEIYRVEGDVKVGQRSGWHVYKPKNVSTSQMLPATARRQKRGTEWVLPQPAHTAHLRTP